MDVMVCSEGFQWGVSWAPLDFLRMLGGCPVDVDRWSIVILWVFESFAIDSRLIIDMCSIDLL